MNALLMLFKTDSDVRIWIGLMFGFFLTMWLMIKMVEWLKSKPWQRNDEPVDDAPVVPGTETRNDDVFLPFQIMPGLNLGMRGK